MTLEIGLAFRIGNAAARPDMVVVRHAVLGDILRQTRRIILGKAAKEEPEPCRIDLPSHVGFRQIAANAPEPDMRLAAVGQNHRPRVVIASDPVQRRADQRQIFLIPVRHMPIEKGENILRIARLEDRFLEPAVVDAVEQRRLCLCEVGPVSRYGELLVQDTADIPVPVRSNHFNRPAMRQLNVMHGSGGGADVLKARGMMSPVVA